MRILTICAILLTFVACKKESTQTPIGYTGNGLQHFPLNHGSYWVYEHYSIDTLINQIGPTNAHDSVYSDRDTLINGYKYTVLTGKTPFNMLTTSIVAIVRDSSGCIVNHEGAIWMNENNFHDTINRWNLILGDTVLYADAYSIMEEFKGLIETPSGTYSNGLNAKETVIQYSGIPPLVRYNHHIYVKNVGKVLETYFYAGNTHRWFERRLKKYHIH
jgi:hypothetical protein